MRSTKLLPLLASLVLAGGCSTPIIATDAKTIAGEIGHIEPSRDDTCGTQRQIAAQSSKISSIIEGKEVVYKAACEDPKKVAAR